MRDALRRLLHHRKAAVVGSILLFFLVLAVTNAATPQVPSVVEGRVVDGSGEGLAQVTLTLTDTTRLSGHVDSAGCGTPTRTGGPQWATFVIGAGPAETKKT